MSSFDALDVDHGGLLSDTTLSALQLRQQPFTATAADGDTFSDDITAEQLSDIKQALINGDDLLLILGENGAGKSTLLSQLGANSGMRIQCFSVKGSTRFSTMNLFAGMLEAFKQKPAADLKSMLDQLIPCLQSMIAGNTLSAIVLDDADQVGETELTRLLSSMLYVNSQDETLMRIALAAPSAFEDHIPDLLPEGADLPYSSLTIDTLDAARAKTYLDFRLNQAGYFEEFPFSDREVSTMVEQSDGLPSELHIAAADLLNERHGEYEETIPPELIAPSSGMSGSKGGKLILGALAGALIIGGLVLFKKPGDTADEDRYRVVEQRKIDADANKISLVNEGSNSSDADSSAGNDSSASGDTANANTVANTVSTSADDSDAAGDSNVDATQSASNSGSGAGGNAETNAENEVSNNADSTAANSTGSDDNTSTSASNAGNDNSASDNADSSDSESSTGNNNTASSDSATAENATASSNQGTSTDTSNTSQDSDSGASNIDANSNDDAANTETIVSDTEIADQSSSSSEEDDTANNNDSDAIAETDNQSEESADTAGVLESPNWVLTQDANLFTVQMSASTDREVVEKFLTLNPLDPPNSIFSFDRNGTTWYALVHGLYPSINAARGAVERMPASALTNQPWIRAVGRIQKALKEQN